MSHIKILDCTLRDGGYINNWNFGSDIIKQIITKLSIARIDIIEVGFLTSLSHTEHQSLFSNSKQLDSVTGNRDDSHTKIAAMIAIGEKELDPQILPMASETNLDIVRITFHNTTDELEKAFSYAKCLHDKGYDVCMQPVGTTSYTDKELLVLIEKINQLKPYALYLVDTLGILHPKELLYYIDLMDRNLADGIKLGFHSHNNLQMSYANAQAMSQYQTNRELIVDSSVYGMGRGAGNLCTELIAQYENTLGESRYDLIPIYEILDEFIYPIFTRFQWGYNAHYYISASHVCHPNYASYLMNKQTLTMNEVNLILKNIPVKDRYVYNKLLIEELYYSFQNNNIEDSETCQILSNKLCSHEILLLAPGKSLTSNKKDIDMFIEKHNPVVLSINSKIKGFPVDYVFISNLKRLYNLNTVNLNIPVILTSNLPKIVQNGLYIDYASLCNQSYEEMDNSGIMLLRLMKRLGIKKVYVAGYDGFVQNSVENYFNIQMINSVSPDNIELKNRSIKRQLHNIMQEMEIIFITPSIYEEKDK